MHESGESFCLKDAEDQILGYFYYEDEAGGSNMKRLTRDQARRIPSPRAAKPHGLVCVPVSYPAHARSENAPSAFAALA